MHDNLPDRLDESFNTITIGDTIHEVPPHAVVELTVDGRRAVCKYDTGPTGSAGLEGRIMAFVGDQTDLPVPEVLDTGAGHFVAAWHDGAPTTDESPMASEPWARAAGRAMATMHDQTAPSLDGFGVIDPDGSNGAVGEAATWHEGAMAYLKRRKRAIEPYGYAESADRAMAYLERHPEAFDGAGGPVCCHGWFTPEHVAIDDGRVICVVDFEHTMAAPAAFDYWRTVIPAFGPDAPDTAELAFREGYESVRQLPDGFEERRPAFMLLILVYYLESLFVQAQHSPSETARRAADLAEAVASFTDESCN